MQMFLISYDLAAPTQNKNAMTSAIMMLGQSWARPLEQTWYIKADVEAGDIEQVLGRLLGDDDGLLVQSVADEAIMANTGSSNALSHSPVLTQTLSLSLPPTTRLPHLPTTWHRSAKLRKTMNGGRAWADLVRLTPKGL